MSPLFSEPSSGSPLHYQEKKKSKFLHWLAVLHVVCSWPPSWGSPLPPSPAHLTSFTFALWFLECARPCFSIKGCSGIFLSLECSFPLYLHDSLCFLYSQIIFRSMCLKLYLPPATKKLYSHPSPLHILFTLFYFSF